MSYDIRPLRPASGVDPFEIPLNPRLGRKSEDEVKLRSEILQPRTRWQRLLCYLKIHHAESAPPGTYWCVICSRCRRPRWIW